MSAPVHVRFTSICVKLAVEKKLMDERMSVHGACGYEGRSSAPAFCRLGNPLKPPFIPRKHKTVNTDECCSLARPIPCG